MKKCMSICVLVVLLCGATNADAFNFNFNNTKVAEIAHEVSPRIPFWQTAEVEAGDTFSQYCIDFLRVSGLSRHYPMRNCFESIMAVNGYSKSQLHWIYPGQIVWLPSLQNVRLGEVGVGEPFVNVDQLRTLLGLNELEAKVDALPDEMRVNEMISEATEKMVGNTLPELVTDEVGRQLAEVDPVIQVESESEEKSYVPWWFFWLVLLLAGLALLGVIISWLRPASDKTARQTAHTAIATAEEANAKSDEAGVRAEKATKDAAELSKVSKGFGDQLKDVDKRVSIAQAAADEAGELAASAMALLRFGDFKVVCGYPTQTAVNELKPDETIVVALAHIDDENDIRYICFTCVANAFNDGRDGLKIDGITNQRRPIAKQLRSMATAIANGAKSNHLQGVERKEPKQKQRKAS